MHMGHVISNSRIGMDGNLYSNSTISPFSTGLPATTAQSPLEIWEQFEARRKFEEAMKSTEVMMEGPKFDGESVVNHYLKYKGITFSFMGPPDMAEFFEDLKDIQRDELRVFEITHPKYYTRMKSEWVSSYVKYQASIVFESD